MFIHVQDGNMCGTVKLSVSNHQPGFFHTYISTPNLSKHPTVGNCSDEEMANSVQQVCKKACRQFQVVLKKETTIQVLYIW